jgi:CHRD domain
VRRRTAVLTIVLLATIGVTLSFADGGRRLRNLGARLSGYQEVPALSTTGNARFEARINRDETEVEWKLSYADFEGDVTQSHIHFNARALNGPIVVFFCTNLNNGPTNPDGTQIAQECPDSPATIEGRFTAADVLGGAAGVGLEAGNLAELIDAIRAGATYVNVHSTLRPGGEVRGQIGADSNDDHHDR